MARGRSAGYEDQREHILQCAARLFAQRGYHGTTMNEVALASGLSKATLYHYYRDKYALLVSIAQDHVEQLHALVQSVAAQKLPPNEWLRALIVGFVHAYAHARDAHRVLTEDVRFLNEQDRAKVLGLEREIVAGLAHVVGLVRPNLKRKTLTKPLTMLLFGMINWMFTWMKPEAGLNYEAMAPVVADLFLGGLNEVNFPKSLEPKGATA